VLCLFCLHPGFFQAILQVPHGLVGSRAELSPLPLGCLPQDLPAGLTLATSVLLSCASAISSWRRLCCSWSSSSRFCLKITWCRTAFS
jgi:hypothetical protein